MALANPVGPGDLQIIDARLRAFYEPSGPASGDRKLLHQDEFTGLAAVQHLLSFVLAQPKSAGSSVRWRNTYVLIWAMDLTINEGRTNEPFLRKQIYRRLAELLRRHRQATESRSLVVSMFDNLGLWSTRELPFLARAAGRSGHLPIAFAERASALLESEAVEEPDVLRMVAAIREFRDPSDEQFLLLLQSGYATRDDRIRMLFNLSNRLSAPEARAAGLYAPGAPARALTESLMDQYAEGEPLVVDAVREVLRRSERTAGLESDLTLRRKFMMDFRYDTLFGRTPRQVRVNEPVAPANPGSDPAVVPETRGILLQGNFGAPGRSGRVGSPDASVRAPSSRAGRRSNNVIKVDFSCNDEIIK